jgi:hypothetical protein
MCGFHLCRTTLYDTVDNDLVERLQRTLKAVVMYRADEQWTNVLLLHPLGIRIAYEEDLQSSATKLDHGDPCVSTLNWYQPPRRSMHPSSYSSSTATWTILDQPQQHAFHPVPNFSIRISETRPTRRITFCHTPLVGTTVQRPAQSNCSQ